MRVKLIRTKKGNYYYLVDTVYDKETKRSKDIRIRKLDEEEAQKLLRIQEEQNKLLSLIRKIDNIEILKQISSFIRTLLATPSKTVKTEPKKSAKKKKPSNNNASKTIEQFLT